MLFITGLCFFKGHFPANFPLKHQQKDMRLALQMGESLEQPLHVAGAANEVSLLRLVFNYVTVGLIMSVERCFVNTKH